VTPLEQQARTSRVPVSIEPVQSEYVRQLVHACPALEDQLADVYRVLTAVSVGESSRADGPLDSARTAYMAYLRKRQLTFTQLVAEIAAVCACVFVHDDVCLRQCASNE
jgi:hypothetical protein